MGSKVKAGAPAPKRDSGCYLGLFMRLAYAGQRYDLNSYRLSRCMTEIRRGEHSLRWF